MFFAAGSWVYNATKAPVCLDNEVIALFVSSCLGTYGALSDHFSALFPQPYHVQLASTLGQVVSSIWDGWDGISELHPYLGAPYTLLFTSCTELRSAVPRPKCLTLLDSSSGFHAVKVTFM